MLVVNPICVTRPTKSFPWFTTYTVCWSPLTGKLILGPEEVSLTCIALSPLFFLKTSAWFVLNGWFGK